MNRPHGHLAPATALTVAAIASIVLSCAVFANESLADVDYVKDIKPILKAKCYSCHGAVKQEAGLRLDTATSLRTGGDSGPAIDVSDSESSLIMERVATTDESIRMPPEGEPLTSQQVSRFRDWIESGGGGPVDETPMSDPKSHWAFQPIRSLDPGTLAGDSPTAGSVDRHGVGRHPIDRFIRIRSARAGIAPARPADSVALIRRMFLDLHGLPPAPEQISQWQARIDRDRRQTLRLIDELLAGPRYGERWAQHWLDIVRYADTHGYEVNTPRPNAWPYRDYVIDSFNQDRPYDQFVTEQLAGDAFGQDAATGFMVAAAALLPGQIGKDAASIRSARQDALDEIIVGTSATFLAMTVGCARCHDHKFDPIPQSDYYAMQAFFAGVAYGDREIRDSDFRRRVARADSLRPTIDSLRERLLRFQPLAFTGRSILIDDEDLDRVTLLKTKKGHGSNPEGVQRGHSDDVGDANRFANLSRGRYTWWANRPGEDVFTWNLDTAGRYRLWISWGVHGSGVHTRDARYVLDRDGDLTTHDDQTEIARADQYYFSGVDDGETEMKPLWSGLHDTGVHDLDKNTRLVLRGGETGTGITADVVVLQEVSGDSPASPQPQRLPSLRGPVSAGGTIEHFRPRQAKFVRFTSQQTIDDNKHQPCIDELEVFSAGKSPTNVALAKRGTRSSSSGNYSDTGKHQLGHINDGRYGNSFSWISDRHGRGWVQLEFPQVETIDRIEWARDREGKFKDRLTIRYEITTSVDGDDWHVVASSADRVRIGTPYDEMMSPLRGDGEAKELRSAATRLKQLEQQQQALRKPNLVFGGNFREPEKTFVLSRGDPEQPQGEIFPRVLTAIGSLSLSADIAEQQRRVALAKWITSSDNPLTARVLVNRVWQYHFGSGLVETPSDFGLNGAVPTHPELLDWLSAEFIRSGWSIKRLHRLIMSSQTYQQSSVWAAGNISDEPDPFRVDADGKLLWRYPSRRIEAEAIRDCMLHVSGRLQLQTGGPGFDFFKTRGGLSGFPPKEHFGANEMRRMIYSHKIRMERVPVFGAFDCPDAGLPTPTRGDSTTAIQALNLFNSPFVIEQANFFAQRIEREVGVSVSRQVDRAYQLAFGRTPRASERPTVERVVRTHGLSTLCRVLFNSSEFLFIP